MGLTTKLLIPARPWVRDAECRGMQPDIFFPERGAPLDEAKAVCERCSVIVECLEYALAAGEKSGIWGGLSERERVRLRRKRITARSYFAERVDRAADAKRLQRRGWNTVQIAAQLGVSTRTVNRLLLLAESEAS